MFHPLLLSSLLHNSLSVLLNDAQLLGLGPGYTFRLRQGFSEISGFGLAAWWAAVAATLLVSDAASCLLASSSKDCKRALSDRACLSSFCSWALVGFLDAALELTVLCIFLGFRIVNSRRRGLTKGRWWWFLVVGSLLPPICKVLCSSWLFLDRQFNLATVGSVLGVCCSVLAIHNG